MSALLSRVFHERFFYHLSFGVIVFFVGGALFFAWSDPILAQTTSLPPQLENIPGFEGTKAFPEYVQSVYSLGLWIVGLSAMFMLIVGGFMYMTSAGNTSNAGSAKGIIKDSLIGLVLGLAAWLILHTINPDLVQLGSNLSGLNTSTGGVYTPPSAPPDGDLQSLAKQILQSHSVSTSGSCKDASGNVVSPSSNLTEVANGQSMTVCSSTCQSSGTACEGKVNPSLAMFQALVSAAESGQRLTINSLSGGAHTSNSDHYKGTAVDIDQTGSNIVDMFTKLGSNPNQTFCDLNGKKVSCDQANHTHVSFDF